MSFYLRENNHNTKHLQVLSNESRKTVNYGLDTVLYIAFPLGKSTVRI